MLLRIPGFLWFAGSSEVEMRTSLDRKRPAGRAAAFGLSLALTLLLVLLLPFVVLVSLVRPRRPPATDALYRKVVELWQSSPGEAVALLRGTLESLKAAGHPRATIVVEVEPFGRFDIIDVSYVHRSLFKCELSLGRYEEALQVSQDLSARIPSAILEQVDCLMAMGRRADAVRHLEKNLDVDTWWRPLRRRLRRLSGKS